MSYIWNYTFHLHCVEIGVAMQVIVPQKLFIMKSRSSFFPADTVCLSDVVTEYDDTQHTISVQVSMHL